MLNNYEIADFFAGVVSAGVPASQSGFFSKRKKAEAFYASAFFV